MVCLTDISCLYLNNEVLSRHDLKDAGDGVRRGSMVKKRNTLISYGFQPNYEFEIYEWTWRVSGEQKERETSRYLNRLAVLKELFNVFINRAVSLG